MKIILNLLISIFILSSCTTAPVSATSLPTLTIAPTHVTPTSTATSTQPAPEPTLQVTATQIPCDPFSEGFCSSDGHFIFQRPIQRLTNNSIDPTYPYGSTARGTRDPHHGVEFQSPFGTPVYAAGDGVVRFAGPDEKATYSPWSNFYGNLVVIEHENELFTLYAHLSKIEVEVGQMIQRGHKLGEVGQSGAATGSHLHFEVRRGDAEDYFSTVNPELWLAPTNNENGAIAISVVDQNGEFKIAELTVSHYLDRSQPPVISYYAATYSRDLSIGEENAVVSDLTPGNYRIAFTMNGRVNERWVEVKSGSLTQVVFVVN